MGVEEGSGIGFVVAVATFSSAAAADEAGAVGVGTATQTGSAGKSLCRHRTTPFMRNIQLFNALVLLLKSSNQFKWSFL